MHYVNRGAEPKGLKRYRDRYTQRWVNYYERKSGAKPSDSHWRNFHRDIEEKFSGNCGFCETACRGEVDHFRPKSSFPKLVYEWSNWVFACHDCNNWKGETWPNGGYIDPCARTQSSRAEHFFEFDLKTGEIKPKERLSARRWQKARRMIDDLKLNAFHHLKGRLTWISLVSEGLKAYTEDDLGRQRFVHRVSSRTLPFSSMIRFFMDEERDEHLQDS